MPDPAQPASPDIGDALARLMPRLHAARRRGWRLVAAVVALWGLVVVVAVRGFPVDGFSIALVATVAAAVLVVVAAQTTRRAHEAAVMPALAGALGLDYRQDAAEFLPTLNGRLLPEGARRSCEDLLTGRVAGRQVRFGEVSIATGGKNSRLLFRGFVAVLPNLVALPPVFLAAEAATRSRGFGRPLLQVNDLVYITRARGSGDDGIGVWSRSAGVAAAPGFAAVLEALARLDGHAAGRAAFFSAVSDGRETQIALRHAGDLFRIGGLFASDDGLMDEVRRAFDDLALPLRAVDAVLEAEAAVAAAAVGRPLPRR